MQEKKVLMLGNNLSVKGGITSVISQILKNDWKSYNIRMKFIPTYIETNNIKKMGYFVCSYLKIVKEFIFNKPDVVYMHMSYKGSFYRKFLIHRLCKLFNIQDIIHLHGSEFKKWYDMSNDKTKSKIHQLLAEASSFIVLGYQWNEVIKAIEPRTNTIVVSNTVHIPEEVVKWEENSFQLLFLGVLIKRKGVEDLLNAVKLLQNDRENKGIKLIIAGTGQEEEYLKNQTCDLGIQDNVEFVGWINGEKKRELLMNSQLLVLPSYNEGLPISILEGISYGLPVIASDVGDIASAVHDDENGYLIQAGDVKGLVAAIKKIVQDKQKFDRMSKYSRKLAEDKFSDVTYFKSLEACFRSKKK